MGVLRRLDHIREVVNSGGPEDDKELRLLILSATSIIGNDRTRALFQDRLFHYLYPFINGGDAEAARRLTLDALSEIEATAAAAGAPVQVW